MGKREHNRLSPVAIKNLARAEVDKKQYVPDGGNLYLQMSPGGGKSWVFRGQRDGRRYEIGLGPLRVIGLAKAREKARKLHEQILDDIDPLERRRAAKAAARLTRAKATTFRECAEAYIADKQAGWSNPVHAKQWPASLQTYAYPLLGDLPVQAIDTGLVMKVLQPHWSAKPETMDRVRGRIERVLAWATVSGYREGPNPAAWRGHLDELLPRKTKVRAVEHHPALSYVEVGAFMAELRAQEGIPARALEFIVLTAARTGEALGARWDEINLAERLWVIPGSRMKSGKEHRVPLSNAAMAIIKQMAAIRHGDLVFPGTKPNRPMSPSLLPEVLRRLGHADVTVHGMRACFRSWVAERTTVAHEVAEMALGHTQPEPVVRAYQRGDLFAKRRALAEQWARFCSELVPAGEVISIGAR
jgi:integrase